MKDRAISVTSMKRQVARAGKRWGLVPEVVGDIVKVCEMRPEAEVRGGLGEVYRTPFRLCSITSDETPFSAALGCRIKNGETDLAEPYRRMDALIAKANEKAAKDLDDDIKAEWKTRKRVTFGPGGLFVPAGFAERARRRA